MQSLTNYYYLIILIYFHSIMTDSSAIDRSSLTYGGFYAWIPGVGEGSKLAADLKYPLSDKQASMIKVDPWPVKGGQLCAAQQRLAFAKITSLSHDVFTLIGKSLRARTQAGAIQSLESLAMLRRWACRSEEQTAAEADEDDLFSSSLSHGEQPSAGPDASGGGRRKKTKKRKTRKKTKKRKTRKTRRKKTKKRKKSKRKTRRKKTKRK
jgi:hypothetical protein